MKVNLVLFKKNGTTKSFPLPSAVTVIGRRQDCDLCIPLMIISRKHCELNQDQGKLTIRDLGSRNGTFVNGLQIENSRLDAGDRLNIGPLIFAVQIDGVPADDSAVLLPTKHFAETEPVSADADEFAEFADADEFAEIDDLDVSEAQAGPGQSSTEFFDDIPDDLLDNNTSQ
jgi:pSer/pThr/pTyr-binding forkhead associated (FHA) protein